MSLTGYGAQRYMRAFVHLPLLRTSSGRTRAGHHASGREHRQRRLAASIGAAHEVVGHLEEHPSTRSYFKATNGNVLDESAVASSSTTASSPADAGGRLVDLVTLEPTPIAFAGVGFALSKEFYQLVRSRLNARGHS
jgi:hypothetical protein